jgi:hypothetical protein
MRLCNRCDATGYEVFWAGRQKMTFVCRGCEGTGEEKNIRFYMRKGYRIYDLPSGFFRRNSDALLKRLNLEVITLGLNMVLVKDKVCKRKEL